MKFEELIENEIYMTLDHDYLFIKKGDCNNKSKITYLHSGSFTMNNSGSLGVDNNSFDGGYREATKDEKRHFKACYKAGKYVPKNELPKNIEIPKLIE